MSIAIQWLGHASFRISNGKVIYIDPWKVASSPNDGDIVLVSHDHYDHYSSDDIAKVIKEDGQIIGANSVIALEKNGQAMAPGDSIQCENVQIIAVAAYNPAKKFHPKENNWLGFVVEIDSVRIYYAGDTDIIDEMEQLGDIDVALLPVGGTYTLNSSEAAEVTAAIKPGVAIPYHWGDIVGADLDAKMFGNKAKCPVKILNPSEIVTV